MRTPKNTRSGTRASYLERINRVLDFILADVTRPLPLGELAALADLSPFHFHRVFQALVGETPNEFVKRLRLEKSLSLMCFGKEKSLTTIALNAGFSSSSDFSRSFKQRFGVAPSKFDLAGWRAAHGERIESESVGEPFTLKKFGSRSNPDQFRVQVRELPARSVAYIRVTNPYRGDSVARAARRLVDWAEERRIANGQWLGYQFENPEVTPLELCRYCVALEVQQDFTPQGEIGLYRFPAMLVAEVAMRGDIDMELRLLHWLYGSWLPRSRYVPADQPCFEVWHGKPFEHGFGHFELSIHLPIQ